MNKPGNIGSPKALLRMFFVTGSDKINFYYCQLTKMNNRTRFIFCCILLNVRPQPSYPQPHQGKREHHTPPDVLGDLGEVHLV